MKNFLIVLFFALGMGATMAFVIVKITPPQKSNFSLGNVDKINGIYFFYRCRPVNQFIIINSMVSKPIDKNLCLHDKVVVITKQAADLSGDAVFVKDVNMDSVIILKFSK